MTVTGIGNVAVIQDDGSLVGHQNLFDLHQSTLRFTPRPEGGYFVEKLPLIWDDDPGNAISYEILNRVGSREVQFESFTFPFGGTNWRSLFINSTGSITFGFNESRAGDPSDFLFDDRAAVLTGRGTLMIAPLWHRHMFSPFPPSRTFLKEMPDRVVITWDVTTEFSGGFNSFFRTTKDNLFQAVLLISGEILLSYNGISTLDGLTGVFPGIKPINPPPYHFDESRPRGFGNTCHIWIS